MSHEQQTAAGAEEAPQTMPEQVRLTIMAVVTGRMIQLRDEPDGPARDYEMSRLVPAAKWLTGETDQGERFNARGAIYQYEVEAVHVDYSGSVCRVDDNSEASVFGVYRRPRHPQGSVARAEFLGDFDTRHEAQQAASAMAMKDTGGAGEH